MFDGRPLMAGVLADLRAQPDYVEGAWPDAWHQFDDAQRVLVVATAGAHELMRSVEREAAAIGVTIPPGVAIEDVEMTQVQVSALRPYYARREMARRTIEREFPELRAFVLIAMYSALDSYVEWVGHSFLRFKLDGTVDPRLPFPVRPEVFKQTARTLKTLRQHGEITDDEFAHGKARLDAIRNGPKGLGVERWNGVLKHIWLGNSGRATPDDLEQALREFGAIRDSMVHRHGRVDHRLLREAPTLENKYAAGDVIRLGRAEYQLYSAALWTMLNDFRTRMATMAGAEPDESLARWRYNHTDGV